MSVSYADRVKETSTTTGTGTLSLDGAAAGGWQTFVSGVGSGATVYYSIVLASAGEFETGVGTVTSGAPDTLSRDTVSDGSSGPGTPVSFSAGIKEVILTPITGALSEGWVPYVPVITWTGGVGPVSGFFRKTGPDTIQVSYLVSVTGAVTPPATVLEIGLPAGFTIDGSKLHPTLETVLDGNAVVVDSGTGEFIGPHFAAPGPVIVPKATIAFPGMVLLDDSTPFVFGTGDEVKGTFEVPVSELV